MFDERPYGAPVDFHRALEKAIPPLIYPIQAARISGGTTIKLFSSQACPQGIPLVQGQRSLSRYSSEGFDEEFVVPSAGTAFHDQAVFAWMLFQ